MDIYKKNGIRALLLVIIGLTGTLYAEDRAEQVRLKNTQGEYLVIQNNQGSFTPDKTRATVFIAIGVPTDFGLTGISKQNFVYNKQYLHNNLTLSTNRPADRDVWAAPIHYLYYNNYTSGNQELIAEHVS